jgi:small subunit ribosomal protein S6
MARDRRDALARNTYECLFLIDSNRYARDPSGVSGQVGEMVEKHGGEMLASRLWNEQKLAYPIKRQRKGTYWLAYFRMDADKLVDFRRTCRLNENVLRSLTLKIDPRLVDVLVSHALGGRSSTPGDSGEKKDRPGDGKEPAATAADSGDDNVRSETKREPATAAADKD